MRVLFAIACLFGVVGCASSRQVVQLAPNVQLRGASSADVSFAQHALASQAKRRAESQIISIARGPMPEGERMIVYTRLYYYEFEPWRGGSWHFVRCGPYNADSF